MPADLASSAFSQLDDPLDCASVLGSICDHVPRLQELSFEASHYDSSALPGNLLLRLPCLRRLELIHADPDVSAILAAEHDCLETPLLGWPEEEQEIFRGHFAPAAHHLRAQFDALLSIHKARPDRHPALCFVGEMSPNRDHTFASLTQKDVSDPILETIATRLLDAGLTFVDGHGVVNLDELAAILEADTSDE